MNGQNLIQRWFGRGWLSLGYVFLYLPIVVLVVFSFNSSRQDMVWSGFSTKWYGELMNDTEIISGFGLSLLLMLVSVQKMFGVPERGMMTIWMGHTLLGMAYAAVVVQSRLQEMSKSLEEAAMDLGCKPHQVFFLVTLPNITQALGSAWLLTFTLSLDDVVLSAFLSGPGSSTMPIVIFSRARLGLDPRVNAVAALTILVVSIGVIASSIYMARAERRRLKEIAAAFKGE